MKLHIQRLVVGELSTNCYLISDIKGSETLIIDPGDAPEYISDVLEREKRKPIGIIATHGHFDHILGAFGLEHMYAIPFYIHSSDTFLVDRMQESGRHFLKRTNIDPPPHISRHLSEGDVLRIGTQRVKIVEVPGHTPGSIAIVSLEAESMFVGDGLFADGSRGRTDTSYADADLLDLSITRMVNWEGITMLYPGHGDALPCDRAKIMFGV